MNMQTLIRKIKVLLVKKRVCVVVFMCIPNMLLENSVTEEL